MTDNKGRMTPERWLQTKQLFYAAIERGAGNREAFLDEVYGDDEQMRNEVESLIAAHGQPDSLIDSPVIEVAAPLLATHESEVTTGQTIGPYKIISQLGRGGMGEVYLAQDTRLGRRVAKERDGGI